MDLRYFFQKVKEIESLIDEAFTVIMSIETADGGKPGTLTEVPRALAAKMIAQGVAEFATAEQIRDFYAARAAAAAAAKNEASAQTEAKK
ncbi:MAG TPA: hypothetical protein VKV17_20715 [Bryobacteraceae bacterium]|nr:hypothetical protein [Bryobacteraceae bacterium]